MRTILAPLDGSALAEQALPSVHLLAPILRAGVCLLRVVPDAEIERLLTYFAAQFGADGPIADLRRERFARTLALGHARHYLAAQAEPLRAVGLEVELAVRTGAPADAIIDAAGQAASSLIVMASHGWSGLNRWAIGSVADKVVQTTTTPVLIVQSGGPHQPARLRRIMLPLDGSDLAEQALPLAIELAASAQAELILFHAVAPTVEAYPYPRIPSDVQLALRDHARQQLTARAEQLRQQQIAATPVVVLGQPAAAIVDEAELHQVDLIAMATHGYGGLRRWALGSVADKVLHATAIPLLLVHARPHR
jgi:nucleotide-binding universal stress UspA family protein